MDLSVVKEDIRAAIKMYDWLGTSKRVDCPEQDCDGKGSKADCQPYDNTWHCFVCKSSGDLFSWVMKSQDCTFMVALRVLADHAGIPLEPNPERSSLLEKVMRCSIQYLRENLSSSKYLVTDRGIDLATLESHGIGYCDLSGEVLDRTGLTQYQMVNLGLVYKTPNGLTNYLGGRYLFPIRNLNGQIVSIKGRANPLDILDVDPRRKSMPLKADGPWGRHSHMDCLYLEDQLKNYNDYVIVCEGEPDTLTLRSWGINAIGVMTNTGIHKHYHKLKKFNRVYFALDNDDNTQRHILTELYNLQVKLPDTIIYNITLPKGSDNKKVDVNDYKMSGHTKRDFHNLAVTSPEASQLIIKSWYPEFGKDKNYSAKIYALIGALPSRRDQNLKLLADLTNVSVDMLAFAVDTTT